jgi:hypothetical protein
LHDLKKEERGRRKWNKEISKEEGDEIFFKKNQKKLDSVWGAMLKTVE